MSQKLQPVRGTHDLLSEDCRKFRFVIDQAFAVARRYGYGEIATPVFEFSEVFHRTLGDTSDVVTKETYSFTDRGGEQLTLRPEFTASIARAFISGNLQDQLPLKFFYSGPAFRYERPQKGRQRQFHQLGAELLGVAEPLGDIEVVSMAWRILSILGLGDKVKLEINTLGDAQSRTNYRAALVEFFKAHEAQLSEDSRKRLERNPLRILDSKDEGDRRIIVDAPRMADHLTPEAAAYYSAVKVGLSALGIDYVTNERLVRGLDYYNHTVFEFTTDMLGAQGTVLAGGRYDGLIEIMGGQPTPGIGFAAGIERLVSLMDFASHPNFTPPVRPVAIIPLGEMAEKEAIFLSDHLRGEGFHVELGYKGNLKNRMKKADKAHAKIALIIGDEELTRGIVVMKDLDDGVQEEVRRENITEILHQRLKG
ncbi:MAG TPA: histidine--tRNA ligase [Rickettsiales bacterium]|nr:histidine--tRNA ligase [Rickettsiales bacterium]